MPHAKLTEREQLVATYVVAGLSKKEIAEKIHRSFHTVSMTYRNIYAKLGISKETDLVREWFVRRYNLCRVELNETLKHPAIYGVAFFLTITLTQIVQDMPTLRPVRTARASRTSRSRRSKEGDFMFDPEKLTA